jgi:heme/copper-type cytochrome/quinol oxidase subunit 2
MTIKRRKRKKTFSVLSSVRVFSASALCVFFSFFVFVFVFFVFFVFFFFYVACEECKEERATETRKKKIENAFE